MKHTMACRLHVRVARARCWPPAPAQPRGQYRRRRRSAPVVSGDAPAVDPDYIYDQLATMTARFQHREAGYDTGLPPLQNGHDEYADYWVAEMTRLLGGFRSQRPA